MVIHNPVESVDRGADEMLRRIIDDWLSQDQDEFDSIWTLFHPDTVLIDISSRLESLTGDIRGKRWIEFHSLAKQIEIKSKIASIAPGRGFTMVGKLQCNNGKILILQWHNTPHYDREQNLLYIEGRAEVCETISPEPDNDIGIDGILPAKELYQPRERTGFVRRALIAAVWFGAGSVATAAAFGSAGYWQDRAEVVETPAEHNAEPLGDTSKNAEALGDTARIKTYETYSWMITGDDFFSRSLLDRRHIIYQHVRNAIPEDSVTIDAWEKVLLGAAEHNAEALGDTARIKTYEIYLWMITGDEFFSRSHPDRRHIIYQHVRNAIPEDAETLDAWEKFLLGAKDGN